LIITVTMEYNESPHEANEYVLNPNDVLQDTQRMDSGYNVIWRPVMNTRGSRLRKIEVYTSSDTGTNIRDAETGHYYNERVGSSDEDLYFKVVLATGECKSRNNSSTMFYSSPRHYMSHMRCDLDPKEIAKWEAKRDARIAEAEKNREAMRCKKQLIYVN
jgi:hypothetical protein